MYRYIRDLNIEVLYKNGTDKNIP